MDANDSLIRLSRENIIEAILDSRNEIIDKLLDEDSLRAYLADHHNLREPSAVMIEFIKRTLKELQASPIDLSHYALLILEMSKTDAILVSNKKEALYYADIEKAIRTYLL